MRCGNCGFGIPDGSGGESHLASVLPDLWLDDYHCHVVQWAIQQWEELSTRGAVRMKGHHGPRAGLSLCVICGWMLLDIEPWSSYRGEGECHGALACKQGERYAPPGAPPARGRLMDPQQVDWASMLAASSEPAIRRRLRPPGWLRDLECRCGHRIRSDPTPSPHRAWVWRHNIWCVELEIDDSVQDFARAAGGGKAAPWLQQTFGPEYPIDRPLDGVIDDIVTRESCVYGVELLQCPVCARLWIQDSPGSCFYHSFGPDTDLPEMLAIEVRPLTFVWKWNLEAIPGERLRAELERLMELVQGSTGGSPRELFHGTSHEILTFLLKLGPRLAAVPRGRALVLGVLTHLLECMTDAPLNQLEEILVSILDCGTLEDDEAQVLARLLCKIVKTRQRSTRWEEDTSPIAMVIHLALDRLFDASLWMAVCDQLKDCLRLAILQEYFYFRDPEGRPAPLEEALALLAPRDCAGPQRYVLILIRASLVQRWGEGPHSPSRPDLVREHLTELHHLLDSCLEDRSVCQALATVAAVGLWVFLDAVDAEGLVRYLDDLRHIAARHGDDETVARELTAAVLNSLAAWRFEAHEDSGDGRGLVAPSWPLSITHRLWKRFVQPLANRLCAGVRPRPAALSDVIPAPILSRVQAIRAHVGPTGDSSPDVRILCTWIDQTVEARPWPEPARVEPSHVQLLREAADRHARRLESREWMNKVMADMTYKCWVWRDEVAPVLTRRMEFQRVVSEGPSAYAADEPYFISLLAELARQRMLAPRLAHIMYGEYGVWVTELLATLKSTSEGATPEVARSAQWLRRLWLLPRIRRWSP